MGGWEGGLGGKGESVRRGYGRGAGTRRDRGVTLGDRDRERLGGHNLNILGWIWIPLPVGVLT